MFYLVLGMFYLFSNVPPRNLRRFFLSLGFLLVVTIFLFEVPIGGDFNSLNQRATTYYEPSLFKPVFNFLVMLSEQVGVNVASLYSVAIAMCIVGIAFVRNVSVGVIVNPHLFVFYMTGFQRFALAICIATIALVVVRELTGVKVARIQAIPTIILALLLVLLSIWSHPAIISLYGLILISMVRRFEIRLALISSGIGAFWLAGDSIPIVSHYHQHYFLNSDASNLAVFFFVLHLLYLYFVKVDDFLLRFNYSVLIAALVFFFVGAEVAAFRIQMFGLFSLFVFGFVPKVSRGMFLRGLSLVLFLVWYHVSENAVMWKFEVSQ